jgi:hypothetical protein
MGSELAELADAPSIRPRIGCELVYAFTSSLRERESEEKKPDIFICKEQHAEVVERLEITLISLSLQLRWAKTGKVACRTSGRAL